MSRTSKRSRYEYVGSNEAAQLKPRKNRHKNIHLFKGDDKSLGDVARANPTAFLNHLKYVNGDIEINASNVKCIRHIVRITCANSDEREVYSTRRRQISWPIRNGHATIC